MEGLIVIIGLIVAIVNAVNKGKTVKKNAPGQAARPQQPVRPISQSPNRPVAPAAPAKPTVAPAQPTITPAGMDFWKQISDMLDDAEEEKPAVKGHEQVTDMPEGDSRECEHGSVGGSMAYTSLQEGREAAQKKRAPDMQRRQTETASALYRPAMTAQEMRQAVVMAEILKRPQERMAEQARRWS